MTACWFRLTQPENSSRKKSSGGGTGAMAGVCLTGGLRSTGANWAACASRWAETPDAKASSVGVDRPIPGDPLAAEVFAHDASLPSNYGNFRSTNFNPEISAKSLAFDVSRRNSR